MTFRDTTDTMYSTLFFGMIDTINKSFQYVNCGHNYPLLFNPDGTYEELSTGGTLLGISDEIKFTSKTIKFEPGSTLVIYSDGLTEVRNEAENFWEEKKSDQNCAGLH